MLFTLIKDTEEYVKETPFHMETMYYKGGYYTIEYFSGDRIVILDSTRTTARSRLCFITRPSPKFLKEADIKLKVLTQIK